MRKLDIIIPVFQAKNSLLRLLKSIDVQKISDDICLILVFDCDGLDYDEEIAFANKLFRTVVINNDKNLGPGRCREIGLRASDSDFIMFADSDDYFREHGLRDVLNKLTDLDFDILFTAFRYERDNEVKILCNVTAWLHGKIYRRKFIERNNIHFNDIRANEDNGFNQLCLLYKPKVTIDRTITYVFSDNPNSITRRNNREFKFLGLESFVYSHVWAVKVYLGHGGDCDFASVASAMYCTLLAMYYYYLDFLEREDAYKLLDWSKDTLRLYLEYNQYLDKSTEEKLFSKYKEAYPDAVTQISFDDFLVRVRGVL